jgi:hypothetical protein
LILLVILLAMLTRDAEQREAVLVVLRCRDAVEEEYDA